MLNIFLSGGKYKISGWDLWIFLLGKREYGVNLL